MSKGWKGGVKFTEELENEKPTRARHEDEIHYGYT
jgi:hypothetical protein